MMGFASVAQYALPQSSGVTGTNFARRSPSYGPRPCDVTPPIIQWIPPLIHWDLSNLDQRGGRDSATADPRSEPRPVVAVVETGASTDSQVGGPTLHALFVMHLFSSVSLKMALTCCSTHIHTIASGLTIIP